ncbi:uncharacterized protein MEPE_05306 [Melanopsichium pennsylvanicum]|uniref:BZIP domain-containing protein n=2 Tax=Melanopsichium pennsylvanicum TaxID=63383 RepID=A0AAJ5C766_9BASI
MDSANKADSQQQMSEADADYNSSEYTHSNFDSAIGDSSDQPTSNTEATSADAVHDAQQTHTHAMEAVMQLAQAASQQQYDQQQQQPSTPEEHQNHGHVKNPQVHHDALPVATEENVGDKRGEKRRASQGGGAPAGRRGSKNARGQVEQDVAQAAAAAAAAAAAGGEHNLPFPDSWSAANIPAEIQKAYQQHLAQAQAHLSHPTSPHQSLSTSSSPTHDDPSSLAAPSQPSQTAATTATTTTTANTSTTGAGSSSASPASKSTRQLSTSKRAAQNRAAQRAFRERRDKYVKVLESKATRLETAIRVATECKRRYVEALHTIDGLRQDHHALRVAVAALSGSGMDGAAAPQNKADELAAILPEVPPLTTDEEEAALFGVHVNAGGGIGSQMGDSEGGVGGISGVGAQSLDSLSAAAAAIQENTGSNNYSSGNDQGVEAGKNVAGSATPPPPTEAAESQSEPQQEVQHSGSAASQMTDAETSIKSIPPPTTSTSTSTATAVAGTATVVLPSTPSTTTTTTTVNTNSNTDNDNHTTTVASGQ